MKFIILSIILMMLNGCVSIPFDFYGDRNMLKTAPAHSTDLMYPSWGKPQQAVSTNVSGPYQQAHRSYRSLEHFLQQNGIDYEVLPGNHIMVKVMDTIRFNTGSSVVSTQSSRWLDTMGRYLSTKPDIDVVISGHADSTGPMMFNDRLSLKRAKAVKSKLVGQRVSNESIYTRGFGEYVPACTNRTRTGKACNRRVEVTFIVSN